MGKYSETWRNILKQAAAGGPTAPVQLALDATPLIELGERDKSGYDGRLTAWAGSVEKCTGSAVFENLKVVFLKGFRASFPGSLLVRISSDDKIIIQHTPLSFALIIKRYREQQMPKNLAEERYKWELIKEFVTGWQRYKVGQQSFADFWKGTKFQNLIYPVAQTVLAHLARAAPVQFESLLQALYDESQDLQARIKAYQQGIETAYNALPDHGRGTYQEERTIATLLTFRYPEKYTLYKKSFYSKLCSGLGLKMPAAGQKLTHYYTLVEDFLQDELLQHPDIIEWKDNLLDENCYKDPSNRILAQDILYTTLENAGDGEEESDVAEATAAPAVSNTPPPMPSLNQILYGPPGTGKTFTTLEEAVRIANPEFQPQGNTNEAIRDSFRNEYDRLRGEGQIEFITFHQSMSYEDFIEGIKPVKPAEGDTYLKYAVEDGLFKRLVKAAEYKPDVQTTTFSMPEDEFGQATFYKMSLGRAGDEEDEIIYRWCIENGYVSLGYGEDLDFTSKSEAEIKSIVKAQGWGEFVGDALKRFIHWMRQGDYVLISAGNSICRAIGRVKGDYEFRADSPIRYHHFRKVEWLLKDVSIPVEEIYGKVFSMQSIYQLYRAELKKDFFVKAASQPLAAAPKTKNYVLIIDEINRGNVSQIFGELITLIEADKRKGAKEALEVTLPYSGDRFSIPQNLFIIGTMNTADRSVEALDAALRRRFSFKEMMPDYRTLKAADGTAREVDGINLATLLQTINARITWLKDRDHQIGHTFLMNIRDVQDLRRAFKTSIVPLLQEYFFNELGGIQAVLGNGFVKQQGQPSLPKGVSPVVAGSDTPLELVPIDDKFDIIGALKDTLNIATVSTTTQGA